MPSPSGAAKASSQSLEMSIPTVRRLVLMCSSLLLCLSCEPRCSSIHSGHREGRWRPNSRTAPYGQASPRSDHRPCWAPAPARYARLHGCPTVRASPQPGTANQAVIPKNGRDKPAPCRRLSKRTQTTPCGRSSKARSGAPGPTTSAAWSVKPAETRTGRTAYRERVPSSRGRCLWSAGRRARHVRRCPRHSRLRRTAL